MNPEQIIVLGTNGNCVDIAETIELLSQRGAAIQVRGFLDDDAATHGRMLAGYPVLGSLSEAGRFAETKFVNGIGSPRSYRMKPGLVARIAVPPDRWATIVHPSASVSPRASIGPGSVLLAHVSIGAQARIGRHVMILPNSVVSHDAVIGDFCALASGVCVSGGCAVGVNCYLGSNCAIRDGVSVGDGALVGMGAVVVAPVPAGRVVAGSPARTLPVRPP